MYPFSIWVLLILVVSLLSIGSTTSKNVYYGTQTLRSVTPNGVLFIIAIVITVCFAGLTIANDVYIYRQHYISDNLYVSWDEILKYGLGENPLFHLLQKSFGSFVSHDAEIFQLFLATIIQCCFFVFYKRYSVSVSMSIYMFITSGLFFFTIVSWKQSLVMALALSFLPLLQKKRYIPYIGILFLLTTIHPYIILYGILPVLINEKVWTKKNILTICIMCVVGFGLSRIIGSALEVTETVFGDKHDAAFFDDQHGVSVQRIIFFSITPIMSWVYRKRIDQQPIPLMNAFIQMSVISFGFMLMSMSGGANFISRMGTYFEPFNYVALPYILLKIVPKKNRTIINTSVITIFFIFFCFLQLKSGSLL